MQSNSRYGTFLDNYNKENKFITSAIESFFEQITPDKNKIVTLDTGVLKEKFTHIGDIMADTSKMPYDRAMMLGNILSDVAQAIVSSPNPEIKKSGANVLNGFLNMAKNTEDEQLLNAAMRITENIKF